MLCCHSCSEPATLLCQISRAGSVAAENCYYCYAHAVEAGLVQLPVDALRPVAMGLGYSVNALIFVMEAMNAAEQLTNAGEVCGSVVNAARKQFGKSSSEVFRHWNIKDKADIGRILVALRHAGFAPEVNCADEENFGAPFTLLDILEMA